MGIPHFVYCLICIPTTRADTFIILALIQPWPSETSCVELSSKPSYFVYNCRSNMCPENSTANNHDFQMYCFEETTSCKACAMLLRYFFPPPTTLTIIKTKPEVKSVHAVTRGTFFQGYQCTRCKMAAHKECLGRVPGCGRNSGLYEEIHSCKVILDLLNISSYINCPVEFTDHSGNIRRQVQNCFTWTEFNFLFKFYTCKNDHFILFSQDKSHRTSGSSNTGEQYTINLNYQFIAFDLSATVF